MLKRPMKAGEFLPERTTFPVYAQPKFDGYRCLFDDGRARSATLTPFPNRALQEFAMQHLWGLHGLDGELVAGDPTAQNAFNATQNSGVMAIEGTPNFTFHAFDCWDIPEHTFERRLDLLRARVEFVEGLSIAGKVKLARTEIANSLESLMILEGEFVRLGYEGAIVRSPIGLYKAGRSTGNQGWCQKLKRFEDAEGIVTGFKELMSNQNEAKESALGLTKRSSHKENKVPMDTLGALIAMHPLGTDKREIYGEQTFDVGGGFDQATRKEIWDNPDKYLGKLFTYKHFPTGGYELPRHTIFKGWRVEIDYDVQAT